MVPLPRCPNGQLSCKGRCVSPARDDMFCGTGTRCEELTACQEGERCESGSCVAGCPSGRTFCSDGCYDLDISVEHCGECGHVCSLGSVCASGKCREVARSLRSPEVIVQGSADFDLQMDPKGNALIVWRHPEEGRRALYYSAASDKFLGLSVPSLDESAKMPRVAALEGDGWLVAWAGRKSVITWFLGDQATGFEDLSANWPAEARCET